MLRHNLPASRPITGQALRFCACNKAASPGYALLLSITRKRCDFTPRWTWYSLAHAKRDSTLSIVSLDALRTAHSRRQQVHPCPWSDLVHDHSSVERDTHAQKASRLCPSARALKCLVAW